MGREVELDIGAGMEPRVFVEKWAGRVYPDRGQLYKILGHAARQRIAPFDGVPERVRERYACGVSNVEPSRIESAGAPTEWWVDGYWPVLLVPGGCELHYELPERTTALSGCFGMLDQAVERGRAPGVRALVWGAPADRAERTLLLERVLDPVGVPADRGAQSFRVAVPPGVRHVVLEMMTPEAAVREARWAYWGDLFFE